MSHDLWKVRWVPTPRSRSLPDEPQRQFSVTPATIHGIAALSVWRRSGDQPRQAAGPGRRAHRRPQPVRSEELTVPGGAARRARGSISRCFTPLHDRPSRHCFAALWWSTTGIHPLIQPTLMVATWTSNYDFDTRSSAPTSFGWSATASLAPSFSFSKAPTGTSRSAFSWPCSTAGHQVSTTSSSRSSVASLQRHTGLAPVPTAAARDLRLARRVLSADIKLEERHCGSRSALSVVAGLVAVACRTAPLPVICHRARYPPQNLGTNRRERRPTAPGFCSPGTTS